MNTATARLPLQEFQPHRLVAGAYAQTILGRRIPDDLIVRQREQPLVLDCGADATGHDGDRAVRLHGYYTVTPALTGRRGLVLMLHGWGGCSHSANILCISDALLRTGYDVFRLNLRDHGPNLHIDHYSLNRGLFMGTLLDEVAAAVQQVAQMAGSQPFYIVGGSMGGNFALRLALRHAQQPIHNLKHVIAICPAVNPARTTDAMDRNALYRRYFRTRLLNALSEKETRFPEIYDFSEVRSIPTIRAMTEWLVHNHSDYTNADEYFQHYAVASAATTSLTVRTTIVTAMNDAVIPVADLYALAPHPLLALRIHRTGGHMGFVDLFPYRHWLPQEIVRLIQGEG